MNEREKEGEKENFFSGFVGFDGTMTGVFCELDQIGVPFVADVFRGKRIIYYWELMGYPCGIALQIVVFDDLG